MAEEVLDLVDSDGEDDGAPRAARPAAAPGAALADGGPVNLCTQEEDVVASTAVDERKKSRDISVADGGAAAAAATAKRPKLDRGGPSAARTAAGPPPPPDDDNDDIVVVGVCAPPSKKAAEAKGATAGDDGILVVGEKEGTPRGKRSREEASDVVDLLQGAPLAPLNNSTAEPEAVRLRRELEETKRKLEKAQATGAAIPAHWRPMVEDTYLFVDLPLPDGTGRAATDGAEQYGSQLAEMTRMGFARDEARAALGACGGNVEHAMTYAVTQREGRGAAGRSSGSAPRPGSKRGARRQADAEEVQRVLQRFEASGMSRASVVRVQRVQHKKLWTRYVDRRNEVAELCRTRGVHFAHMPNNGAGDWPDREDAGRRANERMLFHGADAGAVSLITTGGFECRIASMGGALGAGAYFAEDSTYSHQYSLMPPHSAPGPGAGYRYGAQQAQAPPTHVPGASRTAVQPANGMIVMILSRVSLGAVGNAAPQIRIAPSGYNSVGNGGTRGQSSIYAVFDNYQAYPEYVITYSSRGSVGRAPVPVPGASFAFGGAGSTSSALAAVGAALGAAAAARPWGGSRRTSRSKKARGGAPYTAYAPPPALLPPPLPPPSYDEDYDSDEEDYW